jgi:hypothetical protein
MRTTEELTSEINLLVRELNQIHQLDSYRTFHDRLPQLWIDNKSKIDAWQKTQGYSLTLKNSHFLISLYFVQEGSQKEDTYVIEIDIMALWKTPPKYANWVSGGDYHTTQTFTAQSKDDAWAEARKRAERKVLSVKKNIAKKIAALEGVST